MYTYHLTVLLHTVCIPCLRLGVVGRACAVGAGCSKVSDFKFVLTRNIANAQVADVQTCGSNHLPDELTVTRAPGCFATVLVYLRRRDAAKILSDGTGHDIYALVSLIRKANGM